MGNAYSNLGKYQKAIDYYNQALEVALKIGDRQNEGTWLSNLGNVYLRLEQYEQAISYSEQALEVVSEIGDRKGKGFVFWLFRICLP